MPKTSPRPHSSRPPQPRHRPGPPRSGEFELLRRVDAYIEKLFVGRDRVLTAALAASRQAGLPPIHVSPNEGRLLSLLAALSGARRILEIGSLGGYSAICLGRALPKGGKLITLELEEKHAQVARANLRRAGLAGKTEVRVGPALKSLKRMVAAREPAFDLVFIDADKTGYPVYLKWTLKLVRPGTLILADNVIRPEVLKSRGGDASARAIRTFNRMLARERRVEALLLPILRGHVDGIAIARVKAR
jgi:caffeoyl-CoA O-methyltransferase